MNAQARLFDRDDRPTEDHFVVLRDVTWADYQRLLEVRGDRPTTSAAIREYRAALERQR